MKPAPRPLFSPEHDAFREQVRRFCEREIAPHHAAWEDAHGVPRAVWRQAGDNGLLCCWLPEHLGGPGADLLFDFIVAEELGRIGAGPRDISITVTRDYAADSEAHDTRVRARVADQALAADMAERLGLREVHVEGGLRWAGTVSGAPVQIVTH